MTEPPALQQIDRTYVRYGKRKLSYFSGCDYFRLASHPEVLGALRDGAEQFGLNVAASRLTTGNHRLYIEIEGRLAQFFNSQEAILVSTGYAANLVVAQALAGSFSHVLIDERAHSSLMDAADLFGCTVVRFRHRDPDHLARVLQVIGQRARLVLLTDGMFAHDGSVAPLAAYMELLSEKDLMVVDDAHAAGVLGANGRGTAEYLGVPAERIIQTLTLSKAFGVYGGAVLGSRTLREAVLAKSRLFVGNTPMPLPLVKAALESVRILRTTPGLRMRLRENTRYVKGRLQELGCPFEETPSPIIPLLARDRREIDLLKELLLTRRIYPPLIHYPGGPSIGFFRFALSSEHSKEQLDHLLEVLGSWFLGRQK